MKEIGGYFQLEELINREYHKDMIALNSGRNALLYLMKAKKIHKIYLPYFLCNSVSDVLRENEYKVDFYRIDEKFMPIFDKELGENEYLYVVNYYGQLDNDKLKEFQNIIRNIIVDNTHAFFQKPIENVDTIYSCRKFFGVADGAYLYTTSIISNEQIEIDKSRLRMKHLIGRYEETAARYYDEFQKADEMFEKEKVKYMSKLTHNILGAIDYEKVKEKRKENFEFLNHRFKDINELSVEIPKVAFSYPLLIENGYEVRKKLIENNIYVSMLWPNVYEKSKEKSIEYYYSKNIIPIPCDQRYGLEEMEYIYNVIKKILKI